MAVSAPTIRGSFTTDAEFREWAQAVHDGLIAAGLVQTADTGQINFATVTKAGGTASVQGSAIYRFDDALQATLPIFIKVGYGSSSTHDRPGLWIEVGTTTNGAGVIGGQKTANNGAWAGATGAASICRFSGDGSRLSMLLYAAATDSSQGVLVNIERDHDADGEDTALGFSMLVLSGSNDQITYVPAAGAVVTFNANILPSAAPWGDGTPSPSVNGADVITYNVYGPARYSRYPLKNLLVYAGNDITQDAAVSVEAYSGEPHTYRAAGAAQAGLPDTDWRLLYRYD
jgi:hypothetical protein